MSDHHAAVTRAIRAVAAGADLDRMSDEELVAAALYAAEVEAALRTARGALWDMLLARGWSLRRVATRSGAAKSTVHDCVRGYRRAAR